ncbi:AMP-binding protein [Terricaulis silvestris]|uniref:Long-chain-fatty-acid--CoA ligase n=1 Tax=Terricaulis silvestris TaxID=2686094 RepID=A0A6I6MN82_9CAUL|nr:AMP-binding protein [Terricaulis silvestris]QGZ96139.1 Long-chain-fatty-acid--CoA ligase [Terricaulis silvestris]
MTNCPTPHTWLADARSLYHAFEMAADRFGERIAIIDGDERLTWLDLRRESCLVARALMGSGVARGDRCCIWAANQARWIVTALGLHAVGATLVPVGARLKAREVGDILRRTRARLLFCDPGLVHDESIDGGDDLKAIVAFGGADDHTLSWAEFLLRAETVTEADLDGRILADAPDDLADILFTSGTTGVPKGVPMTHAQSLIACAQQQLCVSRFIAGDVFAVAYPFAHNAGYRAGWQAGLLFGATVIAVRNTKAIDFLRLIDEERVTILPAVPTIHQAMLAHPDRAQFDLSSIRNVSTGATVIPVELIADMRVFYGAEAVSTGYGLTEAAGSVSHTRPGDSADVIATTTGRPLDNLEVKLVDASHNEVRRGDAGEIAVRGPQIMRGYFEDAEATRAAFTEDGFLLTGDVGKFDAAGNLKITDRIKDMFIVGGFNVYPAEVEAQIRRMDGVEDVAVIGVEDHRLGQVGHAFIVRAARSTLDEAAIIAWCRGAMANYKAPRSVTFLDALPRNATGKVSKAALRVPG